MPLLSEIKKSCFVFVFLFIIGLFVYSNSLQGSFQFDDKEFIVNNPAVKYLGNFSAITQAYNEPTRIIPSFTFALNYYFGGLNTFGYHLVNILIHVINSFLVFIFVRILFESKILRDESDRYAFFTAFGAATLFLVHPIQTESVTYISQRFTSIATFFYLGALCSYFKARLGAPNKSFLYFVALLASFCGMFSKEIFFTFPLIVIMIEVFFFRDSLVKYKRNFIIALLLICASFLFIMIFQFGSDLSRIFFVPIQSKSHLGDSFIAGQYPLTQLRVIPRYIQLLFFPIGLNLDYDFPNSISFFQWKTFFGFIFLLSIIFYGIFSFKRNRLISFGIFWFFITLMIESSIISIPHVIFEHRTYLPSVGFFTLISYLIVTKLTNSRLRWIFFSLIVIVFSVMTIQRNQVWHDPVSLWTDVVKKSPQKARGYNNLGGAYFDLGDYPKAMTFFYKAIELDAQHRDAFTNIGRIHLINGEDDQAILFFQRAIDLDEYYADPYLNLGLIYARRNDFTKSFECYEQALKLKPNFPEVYNNRGIILSQMGDTAEAIEDYTKAVTLRPYFAEAYNNRGIAYINSGNIKAAILDFQKAVDVKPDYESARQNLKHAKLMMNSISQ